MEGKLPDNSRLMETNEHELSDIMEIITPELDGTTTANETAATAATAANSKPYVRIVEQPTRKPMRFRYKCEGRTAGTIPGENSYQETKTFPTVEIVGYNGEALILVSCVTKEKPYRQHPHQLVGKNCKSGICTRNVGPALPLRAEFSNVGIQCIRKKEIAESLEDRKKKKVDPFKTGFDHMTDPNSIELNSLRLCFQAFLKGANGWEPLAPVVSDPLYDRKAKSELLISRLCSCAATIDGGEEIILLCSKVNKDDVRVRFKAIDNGQELWHAYAEFEPSNVHKQTAIAFRTPRYPQADLPKTAKTFIELECPSLEKRSDALEFVFHDSGMLSFANMRRKLKRRSEVDIFQHVLSMDSVEIATKYSTPTNDNDYDFDSDDDGNMASTASTATTKTTESTVSKQPSLEMTIANDDSEGGCVTRRKSASYFDADADYNDSQFDCIQNIDIELEVPPRHLGYPAAPAATAPADANTQTSTPMDEIRERPTLIDSQSPIMAAAKISEWLHSSEFARTDSLTVENGDTITSPTSLSAITVCTNVTTTSQSTNHTTISSNANTDEERTLTDHTDSLIEMDDCGGGGGDGGNLDNSVTVTQNVVTNTCVENAKSNVGNIQPFKTTSAPTTSMLAGESFEENSTANSLRNAFKNPMRMPSVLSETSSSSFAVSDAEEDGMMVVLKNPPAPKICVNVVAQTPTATSAVPPSPRSPPLPLPPRTPSPAPSDQQLPPPPPVPPKPKPSQFEFISNTPPTPPPSSLAHSRDSSLSASRPPSQIFIMKTPEQSPTKRQLTPTPSPSKTKRQGFFSRLFSTRRKSKHDTSADTDDGKSPKKKSAATKPAAASNTIPDGGSREPSIGNFSYEDNKRPSLRSIKSVQSKSQSSALRNSAAEANTAELLAANNKPTIGRSVSSVSGKRPAHLNADIIHIPLKVDDPKNLPIHEGQRFTFGQYLHRRTISALQLADIPVCDGHMELVAIADRQSIKNLCEGRYKENLKRRKISGKSLIAQMNKDLGINLNYQNISLGNAFNLPVTISPPQLTNIKDEPMLPTSIGGCPPSITFDQQQQQQQQQQQPLFDNYRSAYQMSPQSQMSPLSPHNRNATPSPNPVMGGGTYTEQLCTLMQGSTLQPPQAAATANNCQMHNAVFNEHENHPQHQQSYDYEPNINIGAYINNNASSAAVCLTAGGGNLFSTLRNTTSGGCFERINTTTTATATAAAAATPEPTMAQQIANSISDSECIEKIKRDLMQTSLTLMGGSGGGGGGSFQQAPYTPLQNGYHHENFNLDFLQ